MPVAPSSVVMRTKPTNCVENVSMRLMLHLKPRVARLPCPGLRIIYRAAMARIRSIFENCAGRLLADASEVGISMVKRSAGELLFAISVDRSSDKSVTAQVYGAVKQLILSGDLAAGKRLPSSRTLPAELEISRTTAIAVFERLTSEGLIMARTGSGSYVSDVVRRRSGRAPRCRRGERPAHDQARRPHRRSVAEILPAAGASQKPRAFVTGLPDYNAFPMAVWSRLSAKHWREPRDLVMGYSEPNGLPALRQAIADHLRASRGISCDAEQIFVVNGAQQAFDLIGRVLLNRGDPVWFENPGAIGARNCFIACGAAMVPVPVDAEGLSVEAGCASRRISGWPS